MRFCCPRCAYCTTASHQVWGQGQHKHLSTKLLHCNEVQATRHVQQTQGESNRQRSHTLTGAGWDSLLSTLKQPLFRLRAHQADHQPMHQSAGPMLESKFLMSSATAGFPQAALVQLAHTFTE